MPPAARSQRTSGRPRVFYVSYDGIEEPLGASQVLAYLRRLSTDFQITLISFEKSRRPSASLRAELETLCIEWHPLRYHRRPPVLSTMLDVFRGRRELARAARRYGAPDIVHVRSYVAALMATLIRRRIGGEFVFDMRGFWADERVEGGIWPAGGVLYRVAKRWERRFLIEADAIVTLTYASIPQIRKWTPGRDVPIEVIPTCVDLTRFLVRPARSDGPRAVWSGSIGTWYRFDLAAPVAAALGYPLTVITRQPDVARDVLDGSPATISSVPPEQVPGQLYAGDVGLCLILSSFSKVASAPTRFAEYLASGMPVVATPGTGDLEVIIEQEGVGTVLRGEDQGSLAEAAARIREIAMDPQTRERCRSVASQRFDVNTGASAYAALYRRLVS